MSNQYYATMLMFWSKQVVIAYDGSQSSKKVGEKCCSKRQFILENNQQISVVLR